MQYLVLLVFGFFSQNAFSRENNVCENIMDYNNMAVNDNCWYNPDVLKVPDIITTNGYPVEEHKVITADGYILTLFRIPHGRNYAPNNTTRKQPIFVQHGSISSSACWVYLGNSSYGFILADNGYDVWLGNSRGSTYGKGHVNLSTDDARYWNFSYHEMGFYDVPSSLDFIYQVTKRNDIIFLAHSLGTNIGYVYASDLPEHAGKRLKLLASLAPSLFTTNATSPFITIAKIWRILQLANNYLQFKEMFANSSAKSFCFESGLTVFYCETFLMAIFNPDYYNFPPAALPIYLSQSAGGSVNTLLHQCQSMDSDRFAHFDHGTALNMKYYHSPTPPDYDISRIKIPSYIMHSANDWVASETGVYKMYNILTSKKIIYKVKHEKYNHIDFLFAKNCVTEVIDVLLGVLKMYKN